MNYLSQQSRSRRRRKCRRALRAELPDTPEQEREYSPPAPAPVAHKLKRPEIMAELERLGVDYDARAKKAELLAQLESLTDHGDGGE